MSAIKVVYFDIRARGEPIRMVLEAAGKKYEDVRITFDQWPKEKANTPYGQLPYVEMQGKKYTQSVALANYFAKENGMYGKNNLDALRIDEVVNLCQDMIDAVVKVKFEKDEAKKAELGKGLVEEKGPGFLKNFAAMLKDNGSNGYFVGSAVTLADIFLYNALGFLVAEKAEMKDKFPAEVKKMEACVESHPKLKAYLASRKPAPF